MKKLLPQLERSSNRILRSRATQSSKMIKLTQVLSEEMLIKVMWNLRKTLQNSRSFPVFRTFLKRAVY